ncbi:IQ and ubiquitin-like domain-containing protein isoform X1 [Cephus cinctus]|uniref:IQ and ubiquitin-like domain-containing protein isoform X1 n=1 Tax=Cephus cinctus TaxID=211228 RepID=A0AAJ7W756_CEPCN|nr:IQ and ubiquitin-like domain-containing protein isoform X1 [Cephus cinctus]
MVIVIEIEDQSTKKAFLGGWRNILTRTEYHNACTQTLPNYVKGSWDRRSSKSTQTISINHKSTNVSHDKYIQVSVDISRVPCVTDRIIIATRKRNVVPSKEEKIYLRNLNESAIKIQRFYRAYRARIKAQPLLNVRRLERTSFHEKFECPVTLKKKKENAKKEFKIILNGTSGLMRQADFEMLRNLLERWWRCEMERANRVYFRSSRLAAHNLILQKEVELLRGIDCIRSQVRKENEELGDLRYLENLARAPSWKSDSGKTVIMETLRVQRAREYKKMYEQLCSDNLSRVERAELLLRLKRLLKSHSCRPAEELVYLIDQEMDLLVRHIDSKWTDQLRNRLKFAFILFVRSFGFSQDVTDNKRTSRDVVLERKTKLCTRCQRFLPYQKFPVDEHQRISICDVCQRLRRTIEPFPLYEPYERMLRAIRRSEAKAKAYTSVAFLRWSGPHGIHWFLRETKQRYTER